ncbi:TSUP family transporter [Salinithrix halophila]|uniref:Probable membrane transporter protein n=1 Tax=Salinithrix halophila TaxID=1485204 RepID=A0ABV8J8V6_9BACL
MDFSLEVFLLLFLVAILAGWVDTIAGGGGMLTIPAMLLVGIPPSVAVSTNKLQGSSGTFIATLFFIKKKAIDLKSMWLSIVMVFIGSIVGGWLVLHIDPKYLVMILPFLLIAIGLYFLFSPNVENKDRPMKISISVFALAIAPILGFYDGFFGPGTGSLIALSFITLCGYGASKATANAKVLNFTSNISALLYFVIFGQIAWSIGLIMMLGQILGSFIGARMVFTKGVSLIRPVVIIVCFMMAVRIFIQNF